ncbi:hypothetical protein [Clostridium prolinivorans]|uniref:hypothetical protein n=1 Tax=Clostridium prolinivorans TaxID=2769420 RepID=UPI000FDAF645|nr:hypothetical protein [Clostridium prolinivorans]
MNMSAREITKISLLAAFLYIIQFLGSFVLYFELVNFTILTYGVYLKRKEAWLSTVVFCLIVMLTRGIAPWSIMYLVVFPQYALIYSLVKNKTKNQYILASVGFILAFLCGTLIDLPFMISAKLSYKAFIIRLLMGFQVSLGNAAVTFIATIYLLKPMQRVFNYIK